MKFDEESTKNQEQQLTVATTIRSSGSEEPMDKKSFSDVSNFESFSQNNTENISGVNFQQHTAPESHYAIHAYEYENLHSNTASAAPDSHYNMLVNNYDHNRDFSTVDEDLKLKSQKGIPPPQYQDGSEMKEQDSNTQSLQSLPGIQFPPLLLSRPEMESGSGVYKAIDKKDDFDGTADNGPQVNSMSKNEVSVILRVNLYTILK